MDRTSSEQSPVPSPQSLPPPPRGPARRSAKSSEEAAAGGMRLDRLRAGRFRALRLPLRTVHGASDEKSPHHLSVRVTPETDGHAFRVEVKPEFAGETPRNAALVVLENRHEATPPMFVVHRGRVFERSLSLVLAPGDEKVVFWLHVEWKHREDKLAAELLLTAPGDRPPPRRLDTMRLPTIKAVIARMLAPALRVSTVPTLAALGALLDAPERAAKLQLLDQLAAAGADLFVLEAAVRAIELAEETVRGFEPTDFAALHLDDPAQACLAILHSAAPTWALEQAFVVAFDKHLQDVVARTGSSRWKELAEVSAVALARRDPALLDEDARVIAEREGWLPRRLVAHLHAWAKTHAAAALPATRPEPLEDVLARITDIDGATAVRAARDVLREYGFIGLSCRAS
ncbi:MAG: hypothetical protein HY905_23475 [Deltaproteobacteria bacterium]|nr:hypothetical protein [Deltaproteobacteria bacterium]